MQLNPTYDTKLLAYFNVEMLIVEMYEKLSCLKLCFIILLGDRMVREG